MENKTLEVNGVTIRIKQTNENDYISLSDIAKKFGKPNQVIRNWLRKGSTLGYLAAWEKLYNSNFNHEGFRNLSEQLLLQGGGFSISAKKWIEQTNAIGITAKAGRYGSGIFAHSTIAIGFAYWLSPEFQIYLTHSFIELMQREHDRQNLEWHVSKITNSIDEVRNLLDTIPGQISEHDRLKNNS